jgi:hypothetical protein
MQFFLGQVGREKDTICDFLRESAVNLEPSVNPVQNKHESPIIKTKNHYE